MYEQGELFPQTEEGRVIQEARSGSRSSTYLIRLPSADDKWLRIMPPGYNLLEKVGWTTETSATRAVRCFIRRQTRQNIGIIIGGLDLNLNGGLESAAYKVPFQCSLDDASEAISQVVDSIARQIYDREVERESLDSCKITAESLIKRANNEAQRRKMRKR